MISELEFTKEIKDLNERYIYKKDNIKKEEGIDAFVELKKSYKKSLYIKGYWNNKREVFLCMK